MLLRPQNDRSHEAKPQRWPMGLACVLTAAALLAACSNTPATAPGTGKPVGGNGATVGGNGSPVGGSGTPVGNGAPTEAAFAKAVGGQVAQFADVGDLNGDGQPERATIVVAAAGGRQLVLASPSGRTWKVLGSLPVSLPEKVVRLAVRDLPGAPKALVAEAQLPSGEPKFAAFALGSGSGQFAALDYYRLTAPKPVSTKGYQITVDKFRNVLFLYRDGQLVKWYPVATGRQTEGPPPTWQDYNDNTFTPEGPYAITDKTENPVYFGSKSHPAAAGGAPENPLGTRWLGFSVLEGDKAKIWGIHGTSEPESIGRWVSDGCIRMYNQDVEALFGTIPTGTPLTVLSGRDARP